MKRSSEIRSIGELRELVSRDKWGVFNCKLEIERDGIVFRVKVGLLMRTTPVFAVIAEGQFVSVRPTSALTDYFNALHQNDGFCGCCYLRAVNLDSGHNPNSGIFSEMFDELRPKFIIPRKRR